MFELDKNILELIESSDDGPHRFEKSSRTLLENLCACIVEVAERTEYSRQRRLERKRPGPVRVSSKVALRNLCEVIAYVAGKQASVVTKRWRIRHPLSKWSIFTFSAIANSKNHIDSNISNDRKHEIRRVSAFIARERWKPAVEFVFLENDVGIADVIESKFEQLPEKTGVSGNFIRIEPEIPMSLATWVRRNGVNWGGCQVCGHESLLFRDGRCRKCVEFETRNNKR